MTALTAALLAHYLPTTVFDLSSGQGKTTLHNLAQAAHCAAQGKVGSGFDVAAAVWGTCQYRRFSPAVLSSLGEAGSRGFGARLEEAVRGTAEEGEGDNKKTRQLWDTQIEFDKVGLPAGIAVRMCDVDCGSQTVGMVKKVLAWRERETEVARALWDLLQAWQEQFEKELRSFKQGRLEDEGGLRTRLAYLRKGMKEMGEKSGVPIEPESQTELLDALTEVEGVCGGVVPGAGGYDAVALLVRDDKATEERVEEFLRKWSKEKGSRVSLLGVKGEMEGVRMEKLEDYQGWIH